MIYDLRTYTLKPSSVPAVEKLFEDSMPTREKYSPLGAFFHTEFGVLNQIIHIWPYDDLAHLQQVRAAAAADTSGMWPPPGLSDYVVTMESDLVQPAPFMREWTEPQRLGNVYELRTYSLLAGTRGAVLKAWGEKIAGREELSPVAACWTSLGTGGMQNNLYHLWPYEDLAQRERVRKEATATGKWPPASGQYYTRMENKLMLPATFSPMH